ncbi:MAG: hypothetical protein Aurels2KO_25360 [Aureliella sp.]
MTATLDIANPTAASEAPVGACRFEAPQHVQFAQRGDEQSAEKPVTILARRGEPIEHWWWGRIVHDFAGMTAKEKIALDWCHDGNLIVGTTDSHSVATGDLVCEGRICSIESGDWADKIIKLSDKGVPYEASIYFDPWDLMLEWLDEGMQATVNDRVVEGPLVITRKWTLHRIAICPTGADYGTQAKFNADEAAKFSLNWKDSTMTKSSPKAPAAAGKQTASEALAETEGGKKAPETAGEQTASPESKEKPAETPASTDGKSEFELKLDRYTSKFGAEDGVAYLKGGLSYEAALEKHLEKVQAAQHSAESKEKETAQKLASLNLGEQSAVDTGAPSSGEGAGKGDFSSNFLAATKKPKAA